MTKRHADELKDEMGGGATNTSESILSAEKLEPTVKKFLASHEPVKITNIKSVEDLDKHTLKIQNNNLSNKLLDNRKEIKALTERIEQLEQRQLKDDELICVVNRYWNQLNEDCTLILKRFDSHDEPRQTHKKERQHEQEEGDDAVSLTGGGGDCSAAESFLKQLSCWEQDELESKMQDRVHFSKRVLYRLVEAFEKIQTKLDFFRNPSRFLDASQSPHHQTTPPPPLSTSHQQQQQKRSPPIIAGKITIDDNEDEDDEMNLSGRQSEQVAQQANSGSGNSGGGVTKNVRGGFAGQLEAGFCREYAHMAAENARLHTLTTALQNEQRQLGMRNKRLCDAYQLAADQSDEWKAKFEDKHCEMNETIAELNRLDRALEAAQLKIKQLSAAAAATATTTTSSSMTAGDSGAASQSGASCSTSGGGGKSGQSGVAAAATAELQQVELEELREVAASRLTDLEKLQHKYAGEAAKCAQLEASAKRSVPPHQVTSSPAYLALQAQFSAVHAEATRIQTALEEAQRQAQHARTQHMRQIEEMEANEVLIQTQMRQEITALTTQHEELRGEHETLQLEHHQTVAHSKQVSSLANEMRCLIDTVQTQAKQAHSELHRTRIKLAEAHTSLDRKKADIELMELEVSKQRRLVELSLSLNAALSSSSSAHTNTQKSGDDQSEAPENQKELQEKETDLKKQTESTETPGDSAKEGSASEEKEADSAPPPSKAILVTDLIVEFTKKNPEMSKLLPLVEMLQKGEPFSVTSSIIGQSESTTTANSDITVDEKEDCSASTNQEPHTQLLLRLSQFLSDRYCAEMRAQIVQLRAEFAATHAHTHTHPNTHDQCQRRLRRLEEEVSSLAAKLAKAKQEEEALEGEMAVTGEAYAELQNQNRRLLRDIRQSNDSVLSLMTDNMKASQVVKLLREERVTLDEQIKLSQTQLEARIQLAEKQDEKSQLLATTIAQLEREAALRNRIVEEYRKRAVELATSVQDLQIAEQNYQNQLKETQQSVQEKTQAAIRDSLKSQRVQQECDSLRRKYDRLRRIIEQAGGTSSSSSRSAAAAAMMGGGAGLGGVTSVQEVLLAEIQEYKELLTCSTCRQNRKDAILTKCFHVFCFSCLKTRYETRNRKCPRCNDPFGLKDFHRIFLA